METSSIIAYTSLAIALLSFLWNAFFGYGKLIARMDIMQNDISGLKSSFAKLETRMDNFQAEMHKFDVRLTIVEQRKTES